MDPLTQAQLAQVMSHSKSDRVALFLEPINQTMAEFEIMDSPQRVACFLAQVGHESGGLIYVRELASGQAYEGRKDLGNTEPGDGVRFKGRGLIQITGRSNYLACGTALEVDLIADPTQLEAPLLAARSAGWFWDKNKLNAIVDANDFKKLTRRINGGLNGLDDRIAYYQRACAMLAITPMEIPTS